MSVSKKMIIVSLSGLILLGIVSMLFSVHSLQQRGASEAAFARSMMMEEKKGKLQDLIKSTYAILQAHYDYAHDPEKVAATYRQQLKSIVDVAYKTVEQVHSRTDIDDAQKMRMAADLVSAMRYNEKDYLWINDMGPKMVMHPIKPALNGKDLSSFKDPDGKKLFVEFVKICREKGGGFVDYMWPMPGHEEAVPKLSYVKLFKPWGWIVGTGIYLDDVDQAVATKEAEIASAISGQRNGMILFLLILLALTGVGVAFISKRITRPIVTASEMLKDIAILTGGQVIAEELDLARGGSELVILVGAEVEHHREVVDAGVRQTALQGRVSRPEGAGADGIGAGHVPLVRRG